MQVAFKDLLSNIVDNRGRSCPTVEEGFPLIATNCVKNTALYPTFEKIRFVDKHTYANWFRDHPLPGDFVFVTKGSPGDVCLVPDPVPFCIAQDMVAVRADPGKVYPPYLFAALRSKLTQDKLLNMHVGTIIPHFKKGDFDKLYIPILEPKRQKFIGDWYLTISLMFESNRSANETLEAMAHAIYRDWFVDFGPTRRKMEGATEAAAILGCLPLHPERAATLTNLFPEALADNGLPEGWKESTLAEVSELNPESWSARNHPDQVEYVDLAKTKWGIIEETTIYEWGRAPSRARRVVRIGDTIVGTVRPGNGSYSYIGRDGLTASTGFAVLRPKREAWRALVYCAATRGRNIANLASLADGGAYPAVRPDVVQQSPFNMARKDMLSSFGEMLSPTFDLIEHNKGENTTLASMRDFLLPKLMSGEVHLRHDEV